VPRRCWLKLYDPSRQRAEDPAGLVSLNTGDGTLTPSTFMYERPEIGGKVRRGR